MFHFQNWILVYLIWLYIYLFSWFKMENVILPPLFLQTQELSTLNGNIVKEDLKTTLLQ